MPGATDGGAVGGGAFGAVGALGGIIIEGGEAIDDCIIGAGVIGAGVIGAICGGAIGAIGGGAIIAGGGAGRD